jgi:hypothetical protein
MSLCMRNLDPSQGRDQSIAELSKSSGDWRSLMNTRAGPSCAGKYRRGGSRHLSRPTLGILLFGLAAWTLSAAAKADNFVNVYYTARQDQLVVTMSYRGTNPHHAFSLKWGQCKELDGGGREIVAEVLDIQWQDAEQQEFKKKTRFNLVDLRCRPAKLTLRTAPRFLYTLQIPPRTIPPS